MRSPWWSVAGWALLVPSFLGAQALDRRIEVVGQAEVRAMADQAEVSLGVESWASDLATARKDNDGKMVRLLAVPASFGLVATDVRTDYASIDPQYDMTDRGQVRAISGYRVSKTVSIVVRDVARVEGLVAALLNAGANRLDRVTFGVSDPSGLQAEARLRAVRNALAKAQALAGELGVRIGKPLVVTEQGAPSPGPMYKAMAYEDAGRGNTYAPGQVVVSAQVSVVFELTN